MSSAKPPPRRWPLWTFALLFLAAGVASCPRLWRPSRTPSPRTPTEFVQRITARHPAWHVVPVAPGGLEFGFWVCQSGLSRDELGRLRRDLDYGEEWRGVVHCNREQNAAMFLGDYGARLGDYTLFGDPDMIREIVSEP